MRWKFSPHFFIFKAMKISGLVISRGKVFRLDLKINYWCDQGYLKPGLEMGFAMISAEVIAINADEKGERPSPSGFRGSPIPLFSSPRCGFCFPRK